MVVVAFVVVEFVNVAFVTEKGEVVLVKDTAPVTVKSPLTEALDSDVSPEAESVVAATEEPDIEPPDIAAPDMVPLDIAAPDSWSIRCEPAILFTYPPDAIGEDIADVCVYICDTSLLLS